MEIFIRTLTVMALCGLGAAVIWQLPVHPHFKRMSTLGLTTVALAATTTLSVFWA